MEVDYLGNTAWVLDHYFGSAMLGVTGALGVKYRANNHDYSEDRDRFISGLEKAIEKNVPELCGVTLDNLREMVTLARGDWSKLDVVKKMYQRVWEIRPKRYPHPKDMFPYQS